jgi:DNA-binding transcriptional MerR regulator
MANYSTAQAAKHLKISRDALQRWIRNRLIPVPAKTRIGVGGVVVRLWSEENLAKVREYMVSSPHKNRGRKRKAKA